jgi:hypothetical protein
MQRRVMRLRMMLVRRWVFDLMMRLSAQGAVSDASNIEPMAALVNEMAIHISCCDARCLLPASVPANGIASR